MEKINSYENGNINPIGLRDVDICIMKQGRLYYLRISWIKKYSDGHEEKTNTVSEFIPMTRADAQVTALKLGIDIIGEDKPKPKFIQTEIPMG